MPVRYYIIPVVAGPYNRGNPQRPDYVDEIRCNWTGHNIDSIGMYVCKVNTTDIKHTDLQSRTGVKVLPEPYTWDTVISTMQAAARNYISNQICSAFNIDYDETETLGELLQRVINSDLFDTFGVLNDTEYQSLSPSQQNRIANLFNKWGIPLTGTDTVKELSRRGGQKWWDAPNLYVGEF